MYEWLYVCMNVFMYVQCMYVCMYEKKEPTYDTSVIRWFFLLLR